MSAFQSVRLSPDETPGVGPAAGAGSGAGLQALPSRSRGLPGATSTILVFGLLLGGMIGYLVLQTTLQEQAFTLNSLRDQAGVLSARQAYLEATLATQATPVELARAAAAAGLVANPYAAYLVLPSGEVRGVVKPVTGTELSGISVPPPAPSWRQGRGPAAAVPPAATVPAPPAAPATDAGAPDPNAPDSAATVPDPAAADAGAADGAAPDTAGGEAALPNADPPPNEQTIGEGA
jgi:hypothetical protein